MQPEERDLFESGGRSWIRTSEGVSQQIYSLPPLATWVFYQPVITGGLMKQRVRRLSTYRLSHTLSKDVRQFNRKISAGVQKPAGARQDLRRKYWGEPARSAHGVAGSRRKF